MRPAKSVTILFFMHMMFSTIALCSETNKIAGCSILPDDNVWNVPIDSLPVDDKSNDYVESIGAKKYLHPDFGSGLWNNGPIGIPLNIVNSSQKKVDVFFKYYWESDRQKYPIPQNAIIEGGSSSEGDRHVLILDRDECVLYELYGAYPERNGNWRAESGAIFYLKSNRLRPRKWTSADAAGLPILPGLVRYEEVVAGEINHALRFTVSKTRNEYVWPARHFASNRSSNKLPPMGQRFRLKSDFDIDGFSMEIKVILVALKKYGMILADNGSDWFISGTPDERWNNDVLVNELRQIKGSEFEAVDVTSLIVNSDSGRTSLYSEDEKNYIEEEKYKEKEYGNCFLSTINQNVSKE